MSTIGVLTQKQKGFTIVELLIVIVVIGILAAITAMAFNGMRQRAVDTRIISDISNIAKQIEAYNATNGAYPASIGQASSMQSKMSVSLGGSSVLLCAVAAGGYAVFARDPNTAIQYKVQTGSSAQVLSPQVTWSSANLCGSTPYVTIGWGDSWLAS